MTCFGLQRMLPMYFVQDELIPVFQLLVIDYQITHYNIITSLLLRDYENFYEVLFAQSTWFASPRRT